MKKMIPVRYKEIRSESFGENIRYVESTWDKLDPDGAIVDYLANKIDAHINVLCLVRAPESGAELDGAGVVHEDRRRFVLFEAKELEVFSDDEDLFYE